MNLDIERLLRDMTLAEKVGQMFLLAFSKQWVDEARILFEQHYVGAAYISNDNVPTAQAAARLTEQVQRYARNTPHGIPLLLGADQEGAWGVMVPESATGPGNLALGATNDPQIAFEMYRVIGQELRAVGLNALLAPCADCNSNPANTIIGMRSFGEYPERVAAMTAAAVRGAEAGGVIPVVKHFPGHGDTRLDSHRGLPEVTRTRDELRRIDLYPFAEGIRAGVPVVMTAHILFPAFDAERPATLSPVILQEVLRGELGFDGVILSDSMNMRAMRKHYDPADAALQAFNAGVDLLMLAEEHYDHDAEQYLARQTALIRAVIAAVEGGQLPLSRVDDAVGRVLRLKQRLDDAPRAPEQVGTAEHRAVELRAARQAVTVLRDQARMLPLKPDQPVLLVNCTIRSAYRDLGATRGIGPNQTTPAFDYFRDAVQKLFTSVRVIDAETVLAGRDLRAEIQAAAAVIAVTENYPLPGMDFDQESQPQVVRALHAQAGDKLVVMALRDPYELERLGGIPAYVCAFSFRPCAAQAAAEALAGVYTPAGVSPVSIPA